MTDSFSFKKHEELLSQYQTNPPLTNYVAFRRYGSVIGISSGRFANIDCFMQLLPELESHSIAPELLLGTLDGDEREMDELCLRLMECLLERRSAEASGQSHVQTAGGAIPDTLINFLVLAILEACEEQDLPPPASLVVLIREQLGGANPHRFERTRLHELRQKVVFIAAQVSEDGKRPSIRQLAGMVGVQPSTISRWFEPGELDREVQKVKGWFVSASSLMDKNKP